MDFSGALIALKKKNIVKREEWGGNYLHIGKRKAIRNNEVYEYEAILIRNVASSDSVVWSPSHKDLLAEDYVLCDDKAEEID